MNKGTPCFMTKTNGAFLQRKWTSHAYVYLVLMRTYILIQLNGNIYYFTIEFIVYTLHIPCTLYICVHKNYIKLIL